MAPVPDIDFQELAAAAGQLNPLVKRLQKQGDKSHLDRSGNAGKYADSVTVDPQGTITALSLTPVDIHGLGPASMRAISR